MLQPVSGVAGGGPRPHPGGDQGRGGGGHQLPGREARAVQGGGGGHQGAGGGWGRAPGPASRGIGG